MIDRQRIRRRCPNCHKTVVIQLRASGSQKLGTCPKCNHSFKDNCRICGLKLPLLKLNLKKFDLPICNKCKPMWSRICKDRHEKAASRQVSRLSDYNKLESSIVQPLKEFSKTWSLEFKLKEFVWFKINDFSVKQARIYTRLKTSNSKAKKSETRNYCNAKEELVGRLVRGVFRTFDEQIHERVIDLLISKSNRTRLPIDNLIARLDKLKFVDASEIPIFVYVCPAVGECWHTDIHCRGTKQRNSLNQYYLSRRNLAKKGYRPCSICTRHQIPWNRKHNVDVLMFLEHLGLVSKPILGYSSRQYLPISDTSDFFPRHSVPNRVEPKPMQ